MTEGPVLESAAPGRTEAGPASPAAPGTFDDIVRTVAFAFRRRGASELSESDFTRVLSFDLRWFSPAEAREFLRAAEGRNLLERTGEHVRPTFNPTEVDIPIGFRGPRGEYETTPPTPSLPQGASSDARRAPGPPAATRSGITAAPPELSRPVPPDPISPANPQESLLSRASATSGLEPQEITRRAQMEEARFPFLTIETRIVLALARAGYDVQPLAHAAQTTTTASTR
ncbi:MAG: DUF2240 family protein [Thermoplasmatota archaeon]